MADIAASENFVLHTPAARARLRWPPRQRAIAAYALLLPSLLMLALFTYGPLLQVAWDSVHVKRTLAADKTFGGLKNFEAVFADHAFRKAIANNLIYAAGTVGPSLLIALGLALALSRSTRVNSALRGAFFLPVLIPLIAAASLFHNSTPLLYANADHFKEAGLDPDKLPQTWDELTAAAVKLTKRDGDRVTRWGIMIPSNYDYIGWMMSALTMSNGGRYYNEEYCGEVYYDTPSMLGALTFWNDLVAKHKVHPAGEQKGPAVSTAFRSGNTSMMLLSTGSLTHVRTNAKFPYKVAFVPKNVRNAVPIGGASLIIPAGVEGDRQKAAWTLIKWMTRPDKHGWWSLQPITRSSQYRADRVGIWLSRRAIAL